ncbi:PREDICTED: uncharacterized protein LOC108562066 [Nicrophorus vespilloides]|uniref:Uncharacterized protein LOC108562066 n=1 Tax=Nicrophorus vespilloides TaxID=110193 RepID=A0ABM1MMF9_NICVS|nr:PREDICTED: uncharacterized protein LOC108562066 [Nicrophorus vespilloides]
MKSFMVLAALVAVASGDIGIDLGSGYQYGKPSRSYIPVSPVGLHNRHAGDGTYSPANTHYTTTYTIGNTAGNYKGYTTTTHHLYTTIVEPSFPVYLHHQQQQQQQLQQQQHTVSPLPTVVHQKFFFDAPEDLGETHVRIHVQPAAVAAQKSIFIKAPTSKVVSHVDVPQPQPAEKTKVYVLVKKPEEQQDIVVPAAVPAPAAQPEVFFVKYKNQHEAEQKIQDIQEGANLGGQSAKKVHSDHELISSIKDGVDAHVHHGNDFGVVVNSVGGIHPIAGGIGTNVVTISGPTINSGEGIVSSTTIKYGPAGESGPY